MAGRRQAAGAWDYDMRHYAIRVLAFRNVSKCTECADDAPFGASLLRWNCPATSSANGPAKSRGHGRSCLDRMLLPMH